MASSAEVPSPAFSPLPDYFTVGTKNGTTTAKTGPTTTTATTTTTTTTTTPVEGGVVSISNGDGTGPGPGLIMNSSRSQGEEGLVANTAAPCAINGGRSQAAAVLFGVALKSDGSLDIALDVNCAGTTEGDQAAQQTDSQIAVVKHKKKKNCKGSPPEPIYLHDIAFATAGGAATVADILVKKTRTRVRINRLKGGQAKGRHTEPDKKVDKRIVKLTIRMMLGVRVAVGRQSSLRLGQDITDEDVSQVNKYTFPPAGARGRLATPSHKLHKTFKFTDYAPEVFKKLRAHFGIEESAYMMSIAGGYDYLELITNAKSNSFLFYSHDQEYIIKTMKSSEAKFFRKILKRYYEHHLEHPGSLLVQFCGMYMVKNGQKKIPYIVMKCVEGKAEMTIDTKLDLKGSSLGRSAKEGERVKKDNDLPTEYGKLHLGSQKATFIQAARQDAEFLCSVNVMDYSMFTSIHISIAPPKEIDRRGEPTPSKPPYSIFYTFADEASNRKTPEFEKMPFSSDGVGGDRGGGGGGGVDSGDGERQEFKEEDPGDAGNGAEAARGAGASSRLVYRGDGGLESEVKGSLGKDIYFVGIIDILQEYNTRKHAETFFKSLTHNRHDISCVEPKFYCERFIEFLDKHSD